MGSAGADAMELPSRTPWWPRALGVVVVLLLFVLAAWWLHGLIGRPSEPKRQVSKISILPDTPPPPPPPKEEKRPDPPKIEPKQLAREEQAKPDVPKPVNQPIKMEGTAGNGDSPFTSGSVSQDYRGGVPVTGASSPATFADRTQERFYANSARQLLHDEIEHHLQSETGEVVARPFRSGSSRTAGSGRSSYCPAATLPWTPICALRSMKRRAACGCRSPATSSNPCDSA